jgi:gas vesicle protein
MAENNQSCWVGMISSFFTGALLGASLALLFAPAAGKETRKIIADHYDELKEKLKKLEDKLHKSNAKTAFPPDEEEM